MPRKETLEERIERANNLDNLFKIKNEKVDVASAPERKNIVLTFSPVDEELLKEYREETAPIIERMDETGAMKRMRYLMPEAEPEMEAVPPEPVLLENTDLYTESIKILADIRDNINQLNERIRILQQEIKDIIQSINKKVMDAKYGSILIQEIRKKIEDLKSHIKNLNTYYGQYESYIDQMNKYHDAEVLGRNEIIRNNKSKAEQYSKEIYALNRGGFNPERQMGETDEQYYTRLQGLANVENPREDVKRDA